MYTLTAIFRAPENKEEFEKHYREVHQPLAAKQDGMRKMEVTWVEKMLTPGNDTLPAAPHIVCTMYWDDLEAFNAGMKGPNTRAAGKDLMSFAGPVVSMFVGKTEEVAL